MKTQKAKAAEVCKEKVLNDFDWTCDNGLKLHGHTQPMRIHPYTSQPVFFSFLPTYYEKYKYAVWKVFNSKTSEPSTTYDDGETIPLKYSECILHESILLCFEYKFEIGDILL